MRKRQTIKYILFLLIAILFIFVLSQPFLRRALWYTTADIDDYTIFENRIVQTRSPQVWEKSAAYNQQQIPDEILSQFQELETVSFLVAQDGKLLYEQYWENYTDSSVSNSFSVAKSIVSLLIGVAIDEGKISSTEQKVGDFIPSFAKGANAQLTIKNVLTMSSGINWDESYASPFSVTTKAYYGDNLPKLMQDIQVIETPGKSFNYLSGNTQLLAMILEKATGVNVSEYASQKLWQPLGAQHNALWSLDIENGHEKAYCCFNSTARDFAKIGQLILNKGSWQGKQLIPASYVEQATQPAQYLIDESGDPVDFYGYQFWIINHKGMQIPYARGILGQYIFIIPQKNAVAVRLGKKRLMNRVGVHPADVLLYLDAALAMLK
jgi:CubicO group peptidase (beta-lactamase class C family)